MAHIRNADLPGQYVLSFSLYSHTRVTCPSHKREILQNHVPITQKGDFAKSSFSFFFFFAGRSMVGSSAKVPVVFISFAISSPAQQTAWISEPCSVQSTTANPSGAGSTSGSPTPKWKVSVGLLWGTGSEH